MSEESAIDNVLAVRELKTTEGTVVVRIGRPTPNSDSCWKCLFEVHGPGFRGHQMFGVGVGADEVQSLIFALMNIGSYLDQLCVAVSFADSPGPWIFNRGQQGARQAIL